MPEGVVFVPEVTGVVEDWVWIDSNDPDTPVARIEVLGEGVEAP